LVCFFWTPTDRMLAYFTFSDTRRRACSPTTLATLSGATGGQTQFGRGQSCWTTVSLLAKGNQAEQS
jgi:hypothetical protein